MESFQLIICPRIQIMVQQPRVTLQLYTNSSLYFEVEMYWCNTESHMARELGKTSTWFPSKNATNEVQSKEVTQLLNEGINAEK